MAASFFASDMRPYLSGSKAVGVIALSAPSEAARFAKGVAYLESQGVQVRVALDPSGAYGKKDHLFSSDTPQRRAQALVDFARDPSIGVILAARGAYGAMEMMPFLDFEALKQFPKPLIGFSDTTALLVALLDKSGWPTIHGPSLESAFSKAGESQDYRASAEALIGLLKEGKVPLEGASVSLLGAPKLGHVRGIATGGNLTLLASLVGTPYQPSLAGKILFLEDVSVKPYAVHRLLLQMKLAGMFKGLAGVALGDFTGCVHDKGLGPDLDQVLLDIFSSLGVPVFRRLSAGHIPLNMPLPFGVPVGVQFDGSGHGKLSFS
jgi:muramoyltetrapeptide carboxypeptidase